MNVFKSFARGAQKFSLPIVAAMAVAGSALASASGSNDATFSSITNTVNDWATGSLGKLLAISAFIIGMGVGLVRQSAIAVVVGLAFAIILAYGPGVISGIFTFAL